MRKVKLFSYMILLIFLLSVVSGKLYEYQYNGSFSGINAVYGGANNEFCTGFTLGTVGDDENFILDKVQIALKYETSPGNPEPYNIRIRQDNTNEPGVLIYDSSYSPGLTTSMAWYNHSIAGSIQLNASTKYHACIYNNDATKYVHLSRTIGDAYAGGAMHYSSDGGSTWSDYANDFDFYIFGNSTGGSPGTPPSVTISTPDTESFFVIDNRTHGEIRVTGTYGGNVTGIELKLGSQDWTSASGTIAAGSFDVTANITGGQGVLYARAANNYTANDSVNNISMGWRVVGFGQSNLEGRADSTFNLNASNLWSNYCYTEADTYKLANDKCDAGADIGSQHPLWISGIDQLTGYPVQYVSAATGGTNIDYWSPGGAGWTLIHAQVQEIDENNDKKVSWVVFHQGENDAANDVNTATYETKLKSLADSVTSNWNIATYGGITAIQIGRQVTAVPEQQVLDIRRAQLNAWNDHVNLTGRVSTYDIGTKDDVHYRTDAQIRELASRYIAGMLLYTNTSIDTTGPKITSAQFIDTYSVNVTFSEASGLTISTWDGNASAIAKGWTLTDGSVTLTDDNITSTTIQGNNLILNFSSGAAISYGLMNLSYGAGYYDNEPVIRDLSAFGLPAENIWDLQVQGTPGQVILEITAYDIPNAQFINNFTALITQQNGTTQNTTVTDGDAQFNVYNNVNYTVQVTAPGYASNLNTKSIYTNASINYLQLDLYTNNSFNITFKDESDLSIIDDRTINLDLISPVFSSNYSTADGTLYIDLLTPVEYTFRYSGAGFQPRISTYTLEEDSVTDITLWLLPGGQNVTIYVYDQSSETVEGAIIKIYRYTTLTNSYFLVNTVETDFTGSAVTNLELNSEFYKFSIYYQDELKKQTQGAYITGTELTFQINIEEDLAQNYYKLEDVDGYVSFNPNTDNFRFYFNDQGTTVSRGCLKVYKVNIAGETLTSEQCVAGSSATILVSASNITGQRYLGRGYVTIDGKDFLLDTYAYTFEAGSNYGNFGLIIVLLLTIFVATLMLWDITVSLILLPLPTLIGSLSMFKWINIPTEQAIGLEVIMVVLAFLIRRRGF